MHGGVTALVWSFNSYLTIYAVIMCWRP